MHQGEIRTYTIAAANDFRTVGINMVVDITGDFSVAGAHRALGVLQSKPNSGQHAAIAVDGIVKMKAGAAITTPGYPLTTAASGFVVAAVSGATVIGRAIHPVGTTVASGALVPALVNFASARPIGAGSGYV